MRLTAICFAILLVAGVLPAATDVPTFFIERIEVRNLRHASADIITAETHLITGRAYTEHELREARDRVARLPFVVGSDFSLEKGTTRGNYVLVINVNETKPFFYLFDFRPLVHVRQPLPPDNTDTLAASDNNAVLGLRFFAGRRGAFHVGLESQSDNRSYTKDYSSLAAGYTQYDLFGTRAFATVNLKRPFSGGTGESGGRITPQVVVGLPLAPDQTLTFNYDQIDLTSARTVQSQFLAHTGIAQRVVTARWSYNTTNHPFVPTTGSLFTVTPVAAWTDSGFFATAFTPAGVVSAPAIIHARSIGIEASAARWWEISARTSFLTGVEGGWARSRSTGTFPIPDEKPRYAILNLGISKSIWNQSRSTTEGDSRIEANFRGVARRIDITSFGDVDTADVRQVSVSWVRRSSWGTLRLGLGYAW